MNRLVAFTLGLLAATGCRQQRHAPHADAAPSAQVSSSAAAAATPAPAWSRKRVHAWITSCDPESPEAKDVLARIARSPNRFRAAGVVCTALEKDGGLVLREGTAAGRAAIAKRLAALGVASSLVVANPGVLGFDGATAAEVVLDPKRRARLVDGIAKAVADEGHRIVEIDLEAMPTRASEGYLALVRETIAKVGPGVEVAVDVHPKTVDDPGWDGPGAHDYAGLAETGATVRLMTYDLSIGPVPPGPSTKASWIRDVVAFARGEGIAPERLEIGLPAYGYDFPPDGKGAPIPLRHREVRALVEKTKQAVMRAEGGAPYFAYDAGDGAHQVWFDDAESLARLLDDLRDVAGEVRGVAIWGLGHADPRLDAALGELGL